jgi:aspartate/methionine/tyrosine aminotransferase
VSERTRLHSPYMEFAKLHAGGRFNLATSGIANYRLAELPVRLEDLELTGPEGYGYRPLQQRLARKSGVDPDCIVAATGTSLANHLAMAAAAESGDEILIEKPAYELLLTTARFLGLEIRRFARREEDGFAIDPAEVERQLTPGMRLIVITNLHNPSGVLIDEPTLRCLGELARSTGARVLVDEVYLDLAFTPSAASAAHISLQDFIVTTSLTKAYGLSGLRCGWIVADPDMARRIWRIQDLYGATAAHPAERLSVVALDHLDCIAARARRLLEANRPLLDDFLASRRDLQCVRPEFGTIAFPRLLHGSPDRLVDLLREKYETTVAPGSFFEMPQHFRIGIGGETAIVAEGLRRLGSALDVCVDQGAG